VSGPVNLLEQQIRAIADPLIAGGATPAAVNLELRKHSLPEIGQGGGGPLDGVPECRYCGAYGGGGHGGLCPGGHAC
jgi:hypothetical protein